MAPVASVGGVGSGVPPGQVELQYQVAAFRQQKQAFMAAGSAVVQLIQAAAILDPQVGQYMDVLA